MKAFVLANFLGIAYAFSKNIEFVYKRSMSDPSQDPSLDLSLYLSLDSIGKENILALILGEKAIDNECKTELKKYCNSLRNSGLIPENTHPTLKELCENIEQECTNLNDKINTTSNDTWNSLYDIVTSISDKNFHLEKIHCNYAHVQCMIFRKFSGFSSICNEITEQCYHQINEDLAYEALLRTLPRDLESQAICEKKIKESCSKLNRESYYLLWSCFLLKETCGILLNKTKDNCEDLKNLKNTLKNVNTLGNDCYPLLRKCYFHSSNCDEEDKQKCAKLKSLCKEKNIIYSLPHHDLPFNPLNFPLTLQEKIDFQQLHTEALTFGIFLGKPLSTKFSHFLLFSKHYAGENVDNLDNAKLCTKSLKNCASFEYITEELANICKKTDQNKVCEELNNELEEEYMSLKLVLYNKKLSNVSDATNSKSYSWSELPGTISKEDCTSLNYKCYCMDPYSNNTLYNACRNLRLECFKSAIYGQARDVLEEGLFGLLHNLDPKRTKECIAKLVERCQMVRNNNINLLSMCLRPKETCEALAKDVKLKSHHLRRILDKARDYPREKDCLVLEKQCEDLTKDFEELNGPCATLKRNCAHLRNTKEVKDSLLSKNTDILANVDNCTTYLNRKCPRWFRREINPFNLTCVAHHKSCVIMTEEVQNHCLAFQQNMEDHKVIEKSKEDEERDNICFLWDGYCDMLTGNCPDKLKQSYNGKNGLCVTLKENCKVFREKLPLLKALMYNIKGSLTEKNICINKLNDYCTKSAHSNKTLENSCKEYSENKETRAKTCDKLISWMKILCNTLPVKLGKAAKDLKNRANEFKKTKQETEKAINNSGLFLAIPQTADGKQNHHLSVRSNIYSNNTAYVRLVRREDVLDIEPSVRQGLAFDLMSLLVELYLEAKGICNHFIQECIFEDDCPKFKDSCKKIHESCKEFVLPNAKPHVTTSISTTTLTESTTVADTQSESTVVTTMIEGKCVALHSKTTWVTSKSISTKITTSVTTLTQKCKPVPCTTEETQTRKPETRTEADHTVMPNEGIKISGLGATSIVIWVIGIFVVI
ncbi:uncharacterized protein T551_01856 [Pneumocystis jirovecii RU7]|uniref:Major surface glycoprotein 2 C-terminal domain-containing protein n=1 Tax=Pneumocystis jirovecii (strain RU7) TaxID=1408657 RepID=A0A0W4ZQB8_PNEJ7|nr:uncharacterized protein T551_01856 [Pneumocystis jirovecii RU7]KTW30573.1 hypothetical protein T551_01856 [Pneumocystis jirovecii RU7]